MSESCVETITLANGFKITVRAFRDKLPPITKGCIRVFIGDGYCIDEHIFKPVEAPCSV